MQFARLDVINTILNVGALPLFYNGDLETAVHLCEACSQAGAKAVEYTFRGENAYAVFSEMVRHFASADPTLILGVGSVIDAPTAALFLAVGANFIVGPNFDPEIARLCNRRKVLYIPGTATPTEITTAEEFGAEICKVFPGDAVGGPAYIKAVMGPGPWHRLMPTGGVDASAASIQSWISAGAAAVGLGSKLFTAEAIARQDYASIAANLADCIQWVKDARNER